MSINLLWADDDCERFLLPLGRILEKDERFNLTQVKHYAGAISHLRHSETVTNMRVKSILVDIILPYDTDGRGALMSYSGLKLAEHAAAHGVAAISFLTVVRLGEVEDRFRELQISFPDVNFNYFDKTDLLKRHELHNLIDSLANVPSNH
jgi:hypothetical protein